MSEPLVDRPADGVVRITLNRPDRLNALDRSSIEGLSGVLDAVAATPTDRVVVLAGAGRAFCAGVDVRRTGYEERIAADGVAGLLEAQRAAAALVLQIRALPQPVVAAVHGPAVGAGFALALGCDLRIAADDVAFAVGAIRLGLAGTDMGMSWLLPRIVGAGRATEWMLTGDQVDAAEARESGLVGRTVPRAELADAAVGLAGRIAAHDGMAVRLTKSVGRANLGPTDLPAAIELENLTQVVAATRRAERQEQT